MQKTEEKQPIKSPLPDQIKIEMAPVAEKGPEQPQVDDVLAAAAAKVKQAQKMQKAKQKKLQTWHCTECGDSGIQLYLGRNKSGHFNCAVDEDGLFCHTDGSPITDPDEIETLKYVQRARHARHDSKMGKL